MPAPLNVDREAVRVLVVAVGPREAARQMGIPENTVLAWSARYGWTERTVQAKEIAAARVRETNESRGVVQSSAISPAEAMAEVMSDLGSRTRIALARASAKVAEHAAETDPANLLASAQEVKAWAQTAQIAHGWATEKSGGSVTMNLLSLRAEAPIELAETDVQRVYSKDDF